MTLKPRLVCLLAFSFLMATPMVSEASETPAAFDAIKANDFARLKSLVSTKPDLVVGRSDNGISPLMYAAYMERPEMVQFLREQSPALDFYEACVAGDIDAVKRYLALGQDVNRRSPDGFTPLGLSVFFRQPNIAKLLVDAGADVDAKASNTLQVAAIHAAIARSDLVSLQLLLSKDADPNLTQQRLMRPLHEASAAGNLPAIAMLVMFGADPKARNEEGKTPADFAREKGFLEIADRLEAIARITPAQATAQ